MFKTTYYKIEKKVLKKILEDLTAVIDFEKKMNATLKEKRMKFTLDGATENTTKLRREIVEILQDKDRIIKE